MKRRETIYNLGNDYFQDTKTYFRTTSAEVEAVSGKAPVYSDGLYHYTQEPVYELSGGASALNKRIFNKLPQTDWTPAEFDGIETFSALPIYIINVYLLSCILSVFLKHILLAIYQ